MIATDNHPDLDLPGYVPTRGQRATGMRPRRYMVAALERVYCDLDSVLELDAVTEAQAASLSRSLDEVAGVLRSLGSSGAEALGIQAESLPDDDPDDDDEGEGRADLDDDWAYVDPVFDLPEVEDGD
jgi:hypothetical protein